MNLIKMDAMPENQQYVITLYDIVKIINRGEIENGDLDSQKKPKTRHRNAMRKIDQLSKEPSFGTARKTRIVYNDQGQVVETYLFTPKQAIAAAARISNKYLIKVVDELEKLQKKTISMPNFADPVAAAEAWLKAEKKRRELATVTHQQQALIEKQKKTIKEVTVLYNKYGEIVKTIMRSNNLYKATQVGSRFGVSARLFNKILQDAGVLKKINGTYALRSKYNTEPPFAVLREVEVWREGENRTVLEFAWTSKGVHWIEKNWDKALSRMSDKTRKSYEAAMKRNKEPSIPRKRKSKKGE